MIEIMKRIIIAVALATLSSALFATERSDTLTVSDRFTSHIIFDTDLIYADLSNSQCMAAKILEQSKNIIAMKAKIPFTSAMSVSALESNGKMHTFIVRYDPNPQELIHHRSNDRKEAPAEVISTKGDRKPGAALFRKEDAPLLKDVVAAGQEIWHISTRQYDIEVTCANILSYSDITYLVFKVRNGSAVSYQCQDATFVIESRKKSRKGVVYDRTLFPKSRYGTLSCGSGESTSIGYCLDKVSLARDQVLKVYFYEQGGQRELVLTISSDDINRARKNIN